MIPRDDLGLVRRLIFLLDQDSVGRRYKEINRSPLASGKELTGSAERYEVTSGGKMRVVRPGEQEK